MENKLYQEFHRNTNKQLKVINNNNFTYSIILKAINQYIKSKKKILDIGCGAGSLCFYLANRGNQITGIDISKHAIATCKETSKSLGLQRVNFYKLNFPYKIPKGKFDIVLCLEVIEHLKNDTYALQKINSLLKPNGLLILSTPSINAPLYRLGLATEFDKRVGHLRRYSLSKLETVITNAGFEILEIKKNEGILRNFLFLNSYAGKLIKFIKYFMVTIVSLLDELSLKLFGESDFIVIARKKLVASDKITY